MSATSPTSILRLKDLQARIKLSRSAIYAKISFGEFPPPITLGPRAVGWLESDVEQWIKSRIQATHHTHCQGIEMPSSAPSSADRSPAAAPAKETT